MSTFFRVNLIMTSSTNTYQVIVLQSLCPIIFKFYNMVNNLCFSVLAILPALLALIAITFKNVFSFTPPCFAFVEWIAHIPTTLLPRLQAAPIHPAISPALALLLQPHQVLLPILPSCLYLHPMCEAYLALLVLLISC